MESLSISKNTNQCNDFIKVVCLGRLIKIIIWKDHHIANMLIKAAFVMKNMGFQINMVKAVKQFHINFHIDSTSDISLYDLSEK